MKAQLVSVGIRFGSAFAVAISVCGLGSAVRAEEATTAAAAIPPNQVSRRGSSKLLLAIRESALAGALAEERRAKQAARDTRISFPLPTCVFEGGLCGALNRDGSVAVAPQFDWVDNFHEGRARVRQAGLYGYIDTAGRVVVEPKYEIAGAFWRGLAEVDIGGKSALINLNGRQVLEPKFARAHPFTAETYWVLEGTRRYNGRPGMAELVNYKDWNVNYDASAVGKWGLIDRTGAWIRRPEFSSLRAFDRADDGLVLVRASTGWGVIRPDGTWFIEPKFESLGRASGDGFIPARINGKAGYSNRAGEFVIEPKFDVADSFQGDDLARVMVANAYGLIDRTGNWVVEPKYEFLTHGLASYAGLIWFRVGKEWGAIDRPGQSVVKPQFSQSGATVCEDGWVIGYINRKHRAVRREGSPLPMPNGELLAQDCKQPFQVQVGGKLGYVDRALNPITEVKFESASTFLHDVAIVKFEGRSGYIRRDGTWLIEPRFEEAHPFMEEAGGEAFAAVKLDGKFGCIKRSGAWLFEPQLVELPWRCHDLVTKAAGRFAHITPAGTWRIEPGIETIAGFGKEFDAVKVHGKFGVVDRNGAWVIEPRWRSFGIYFEAGLVPVKLDDKWGFIDASGALIIDATYDAFSNFERGINWVKTGDVWCAIDRRGRNVASLACQSTDPNPKPGTMTSRFRP